MKKSHLEAKFAKNSKFREETKKLMQKNPKVSVYLPKIGRNKKPGLATVFNFDPLNSLFSGTFPLPNSNRALAANPTLRTVRSSPTSTRPQVTAYSQSLTSQHQPQKTDRDPGTERKT